MASASIQTPVDRFVPLPLILDDIPILYEDEEEGDMGESYPHVRTDEILHVSLEAYFAKEFGWRVFANMNLYYRDRPLHKKTKSPPYVSPDLMIVRPFRLLGNDIRSYKIGRDGPAPILVAEILSERSAQQGDLKKKLAIYAQLGIPEYILIDSTGQYLPERLVLKRLQADRSWKDEQDADGGVTSQLGFRLVWEADGLLRIVDAATGKRFARPQEAQTAVDKLEALEAELRELKSQNAKNEGGPVRRRKKT